MSGKEHPVRIRVSTKGAVQTFQPNRITVALMMAMGSTHAWGANIIVKDGTTNTTVTTAGSVTDIRTTSVRGQTGFNSFNHFNVDTANTVNLHLPAGTANLLNLVHDSRIVINGELNSLLSSGKLGGNVIFADPHGMVVGASGVVNVGSLTVTTPNAQQMALLHEKAKGNGTWSDTEFLAELDRGDWNGASGGTGEAGEVRVETGGKINTSGSINLFAASAVVESGAALNAGAAIFGATVNTEGVLNATGAVRQDGSMRIVAADSVETRVELAALMAAQSGGSVLVEGGKTVALKGDASIVTSGAAGKNSGDVTLRSRSITLADNAEVITRATGAGQSGDIELAALSDIGFQAGDAKTLDDLAAKMEAELSAEAKPVLATHAGKAEIILGAGTKLDAGHATDKTKAGDVTLVAAAFDKQISGYADAKSTIDVKGSITGGSIDLHATSTSQVTGSLLGSLFSSDEMKAEFEKLKGEKGWTDAETWSHIIGVLGDAASQGVRPSDLQTDSAIITALGLDPSGWSELAALLPYITVAIANADAEVKIDTTAVLNAVEDIDIRAEATRLVDTSTGSIPLLNSKLPFSLGAAYGRISGKTLVDVKGGAQLTSGRDLRMEALSGNTLSLTSSATNSKDGNGSQLSTAGFAFGMAHSDIDTIAQVAKGAVLNVTRDVSLAAVTEQTLSNEVSFKSIGEGAVGGPAIALTLFDSDTKAVFNANLSGARNLDVTAVNLVHEQSNSSTVQAGKSTTDYITT